MSDRLPYVTTCATRSVGHGTAFLPWFCYQQKTEAQKGEPHLTEYLLVLMGVWIHTPLSPRLQSLCSILGCSLVPSPGRPAGQPLAMLLPVIRKESPMQPRVVCGAQPSCLSGRASWKTQHPSEAWKDCRCETNDRWKGVSGREDITDKVQRTSEESEVRVTESKTPGPSGSN